MEEDPFVYHTLSEVDEQLDVLRIKTRQSTMRTMKTIEEYIELIQDNEKYKLNIARAIQIELLLRHMGIHQNDESLKPGSIQIRKEGVFDVEINELLELIEKNSIIYDFMKLRAIIVFGIIKENIFNAESIIQSSILKLKSPEVSAKLHEVQCNCPYLYASFVETLIILSNVLYNPIVKYNCLYKVILLEATIWKQSQSNTYYYDKIVEKMLHYTYSKLYELGKQIIGISQSNQEILKDTLNQLSLVEASCHYRQKLKWVVLVTKGKLKCLLSDKTAANQQLSAVNLLLKKHYQTRLEDLAFEIASKQTFTSQQMTQLSGIPIHKGLEDNYNQTLILNDTRFNSVEEQFCNLISMVFSDDINKQKEFFKYHFHETQIRPEFIYHLILAKYKLQKTAKVLKLIEQFMLKDDDIYRQSKIPSLQLIKLKVLINYHKDYQKGLEVANYLDHLIKNSQMIKMDKSVREYLKLEEYKKKAYYYYIIGITYSIYSDSEECQLYAKRKMMKKQALSQLRISQKHDSNNPFCLYYLGRTFAELGQFDSAHSYIEEALKLRDTIEGAIALHIILLLAESRITEAYNIVVSTIKLRKSRNVLFYIIKAKIEQIHHDTRVKYQSEFKHGYSNALAIYVDEYFGHAETKLSEGGFANNGSTIVNQGSEAFNQSLLSSNQQQQQQLPVSEMKCFSTLKKLLLTFQDKPQLQQADSGSKPQAKSTNEEKIQLGNKLIPVNSAIDYQTALIFTARLYILKERYVEAQQLITDHLTEFRDINPEIQLLETFLLSFKDPQAAILALKELIANSKMSYVEAMTLYAEIIIQNKPQKLEKAFFYLNHCLKLEYRNPQIWRLLGHLYQLKSEDPECLNLPKNEKVGEREFNLEKSVFCFGKAVKYESIMNQDAIELIKLIPKYIN